MQKPFKIIPIGLKAANDFVELHHRHNGRTAVNGGKFAIGVKINNELIGVAICGRPLARLLDDGLTAEITRVCVKQNSPNNMNSFLYGRAIKILKLLGYEKIVTYSLITESGSSLKACGFRIIGQTKKRNTSWNNRTDSLHINRKIDPVYFQQKNRWLIQADHQ